MKYESKDIIDKQGSLLITCSDEEPSPDELKLFKGKYEFKKKRRGMGHFE